MSGVCLLVAGVLVATLPDDAFTIAWTHSVQKTRWEERYRVEGDRLRLVEAYVEGSGAGMEPGHGARPDGGGWRWRPDHAMASVTLAASPFGEGDYQLCTRAGCRAVRDVVADATPVEIAACPR